MVEHNLYAKRVLGILDSDVKEEFCELLCHYMELLKLDDDYETDMYIKKKYPEIFLRFLR